MTALLVANYRQNPLGIKGKSRPNTVWKRILRNDPCSYCGSSRSGTVDHIEARGSGGQDTFHNMTGACSNCNGKKGDKGLLVFLLEQKMKAEQGELESQPA